MEVTMWLKMATMPAVRPNISARIVEDLLLGQEGGNLVDQEKLIKPLTQIMMISEK